MRKIILEWIVKIMFCAFVMFIARMISDTFMSGLFAGEIWIGTLWLLDVLKRTEEE